MTSIGLDIGTMNIVLSLKDGKKVVFLHETNGYYLYPNTSKFIENMLNDPDKIRSDGTKRPARWVKYEGRPGIYVLGRDAEELAYAHNDTLCRPMATGGISQDEDAMMVLASIIHGLLDSATHEIGELGDNVNLCYCTTAKPLNSDATNIDYHTQVVDMVIGGYNDKIQKTAITESHAIVLRESPDGSGIGISWGAGTVTVTLARSGIEVFSFSWAGAGDWIDIEVARRHGYDPNQPRKKSKETPTTVSRAKQKIDLNNLDQSDRLALDISLHYKVLIQNVIRGIVQGFVDNEHQARIDGAMNVYMAGGTSSPPGFVELVRAMFEEAAPPFELGEIKRAKDPLYCVSEGCLCAAELQA